MTTPAKPPADIEFVELPPVDRDAAEMDDWERAMCEREVAERAKDEARHRSVVGAMRTGRPLVGVAAVEDDPRAKGLLDGVSPSADEVRARFRALLPEALIERCMNDDTLHSVFQTASIRGWTREHALIVAVLEVYKRQDEVIAQLTEAHSNRPVIIKLGDGTSLEQLPPELREQLKEVKR